jgi:hypothetical protein
VPASRAKPPAPRRCESAPGAGPDQRSWSLPDAGLRSRAAAGRARNLRQYTRAPSGSDDGRVNMPTRHRIWTRQHASAQVSRGGAVLRPDDVARQ